MATLSISNITTNSFYWRVSGLTAMSQQTLFVLTTTNYGSSYSGQISDSFVLEILAVNATGISSTYYSGDSSYLSFRPGDSFTVYAYRYTDKWYRADYQSVTIPRPKLSTPYYISSSKTSNSITINYSTVSGANRYDIQCSNGVIASPSSPTYTFSNLQPNTQYSFRCMCRDIYGNYSDSNWSGYTYITTNSARPAYFYWDTNKVSGQQFNVTASEWNRLIQNVKDIHVYKLGSYNSSSYPMTTVSRGQPFYAQRFNEVRFAIGSLNSTGLNNKYKGDTIYASELNILKDKLNAIT